MDYEHIRNLLRETVLRYDDRIDSNLFIPNVEKQAEGYVDPNFGVNLFSEGQRRVNNEISNDSNSLKEEISNDAGGK